MTKTLRAGVAGAGVFGGHHARKYAGSDGVELVGVYDRGTGRALALAETLGVRGFEADHWDEFIESVDVLTIAAPALAHGFLAVRALERGVHVYVEKPLAATIQESEAILGAARDAGCVVACGHQERIVFSEMGLFDAPERPTRVEAVRKGTWTGRNDDVSVVLDLMIHDLDLALMLAGDEPKAVTANGRRHNSSVLADAVEAEIGFSGGMVAAFTASRSAEARERTMRVVYPSGAVEIDFLARTFRSDLPFELRPDFADTLRGKDPLGASVSDFLAAVRGRAKRPAVTGDEAGRALALALAVEEAVNA
jgi:predicted dehydrogenase